MRRAARTKKIRHAPILFLAVFLVCLGVFLYHRVLPGAAGGPGDIKAAVGELAARSGYSERIYVTDRGIVASGTGRVAEDTSQGRLLARRAALSDARRNLLALRKLYGRTDLIASPSEVSGRTGSHGVRSERVEGGLYTVEVEIPFEEWLSSEIYE